jgi:alkylated DNA repair dioxygenase AlkB
MPTRPRALACRLQERNRQGRSSREGMTSQTQLFQDSSPLPDGLRYERAFLSTEEEAALLETIRRQPLREAQYKEWNAKRRIVSYGGSYDFSSNELLPAGPVPSWLHPLRARIAAWVGIPATEFNHVLVAEYSPGTQLGWHRDVPDFEAVVGVSLLGKARMRLRRYPAKVGHRRAELTLDLEPRSIYAMRGPARWEWQHAISPTKALRYSITFRTLAAARPRSRTA